MKLTSIFALTLIMFALVACGKPTVYGDAYTEGYGETHEGQPAVGRNALPDGE